MKEYIYKITISNVRVSVTVIDDCFQIADQSELPAITQVKSIHNHATYEMFFVTGGRLSVMQEDGFEGYERSAVIVPPLLNHYVITNAANCYGMYFTIDRSKSVPEGYYDTVKDIIAYDIVDVPLGEEEMFYISKLAKIVKEESISDRAEHLLYLLFSCIFDKLVPNKLKKNEMSAKRAKYVSTIERYVTRNYSKKILLEDIAAELYLCPKQVSRIIRREYGCSLSELVNGKRLASAVMLLKHTDIKVGKIASSVGYDCENYFYTRFREVYGMTPEKYRNEYRVR